MPHPAPRIIAVSELRLRQREIFEGLKVEPVVLTLRGSPAAVLLSLEMWHTIYRRLEVAEAALAECLSRQGGATGPSS